MHRDQGPRRRSLQASAMIAQTCSGVMPENSNLQLSHWSQSELARAKRSGAASWNHLARLDRAFLKEADLKPHRVRGWLTPKSDPEFESKCADVCSVYKQVTVNPNLTSAPY
jgi:hypothetical protein